MVCDKLRSLQLLSLLAVLCIHQAMSDPVPSGGQVCNTIFDCNNNTCNPIEINGTNISICVCDAMFGVGKHEIVRTPSESLAAYRFLVRSVQFTRGGSCRVIYGFYELAEVRGFSRGSGHALTWLAHRWHDERLARSKNDRFVAAGTLRPRI